VRSGVPWLCLALVVASVALAGCERQAPSSEAASRGGNSTHSLALRVKLELLRKLGVDALHVDVEAEGGRIVLAGEVKKRATAELAEEIAGKVSGVRRVESRLKVAETTAGSGSATKLDRALGEAEAEVRDAALETRVRLALVDRLGSDGFRIGTDAASGVVTLEFPGSIDRQRRREAMRVTEAVEGVSKVISLEKE